MWVYLDYDNRIISYCPNNMDGNSGWVFFGGELPQNYMDYLLVDGELVYDQMPEHEQSEPEVSADVAEILAIIGGEV